MYIEEILKLCKVVNSRMPEEDKVGHVLKGIAEDVYNFLIGKESLNSVSDVMQHCRTFETLKTRRIVPKFGRLSNVPTVASVDAMSPSDLSSTIRQIVREELRRHEQISQCPGDFEDIYERDTQRVRAPATAAPWQPSVNVADATEHRGRLQSGFSKWTPSNFERRFRPPRLSRQSSPDYGVREDRRYNPTPRERTGYYEQQRVSRPFPVCYSCGVAGHIARFCNNRSSYQREPPFVPYSQHFDSPYPPQRPPQMPTRVRYSSPASDRSVTPPPAPRVPRSPSPRRRTRSPPPEN